MAIVMGADLSGSVSGAARIVPYSTAVLSPYASSGSRTALYQAAKAAVSPVATTASPTTLARPAPPPGAVTSAPQSGGVSLAPAVAAGACGVEPARRPPDAFGVARYVDPDAGSKYDACISAQQLAREKAYFQSVVTRSAGGADGCGQDATTVYNSGSPYTGAPLQKAYSECRAAAMAAASTPPAVAPVLSSSTPAAVAPPLSWPSSPASSSGSSEPVAFDAGEPSSADPVAPKADNTTRNLVIGGGVALVAAIGLYFAVR